MQLFWFFKATYILVFKKISFSSFEVVSICSDADDSLHILGYSLVFVIADIISALLIRATGHTLQMAYRQSLNSLHIVDLLKSSGS